MKMYLRLLAPLLVLALAIGLAACGGGSSSSGTEAAATSEEAETSEETGSEPSAEEQPEAESLPTSPVATTKPRTIGLLKLAPSPIEETVTAAAVAAGKALGWNVKVRDGGGDPTKLVAAINAFANEKVEALMICSYGTEGAERAAQQMKSEGTPIIQIAGEAPPSPIFTAVYAEDEHKMGELLAENIVEENGGAAKIGDITLTIAYATKVREEALKEVVGRSKGSEIAASAPFDLADPVGSTQEAVGNMLVAHPDINSVFAVSDINVLPAAAAIEAKRSDAKVYSFFSDPSTLEAMSEGKPIGSVLDVNLAVTPLVAIDQLLGFFEKGTPIDKNALTPEMLEYSIVTPESAPPEGKVVYPLPKTLQPWLEKWEKEYPLK
jgi:ribose transport system substrate-binding protein